MPHSNVTAPPCEQWFQMFTAAVEDRALVPVDCEGRIAGWNVGAERLYGFLEGEILGQPLTVLSPQDDRMGDHLVAARARGTVERNGQQVRKNGDHFPCRLTISAVDSGQAGYVVISQILTDHQRLLQELQDHKLRLRSIVDTAVDAIIIIDSRGIIESFNPAAERMFGYTAAEIGGRNVSLLMPEPFASEHDGYLQHYLQTRQPKIIGIGRELQARRKDGSIFPADLAVNEFQDGELLFTGIVRDISDRKRLESIVLQIAESEQRRIGQELHDDVQQQLTALTMIARHAADSVSADDTRATLERLVAGLKAANQSLRELSRGLVPVQIDAHGLSDALGHLAHQIAASHSMMCRFETQDPVHLSDSAAATHLYRIAQEAVTNALKHSRASEISIRLDHHDRGLILEIHDDGIGIGDESGPAGRGLQIMAYRARLIGAVLSIAAAADRGTIVRCCLPNAG